MLIVQKFGGSSLANDNLIFNAANKIIDAYQKTRNVVVVLSAQGDTTDELISKAMRINPNPAMRELDMLLSTGEQQSVALMTMALHKLGFPAVSLNAMQAGFYSGTNHGNAKIQKIRPGRVKSELERNNIVIVTGFQAMNRYNDITTLGRGGSDTSAVALAIALGADVCEIYTDVEGVFTADPRIVKTARKVSEISYDAMLELASLGANVLHNRSVELAKKHNMKLVVRSSFSDDSGTIVKEECNVEKTLISGIAVDKDTAIVSIVGLSDEPGMAFKLFALLSKAKISVDLIIQSVGRQSTKDISFTVARKELRETVRVLEENNDFLRYDHLTFDDKVAKLSVVGAGMGSNSGAAALIFEAIYDAGINIRMISTSEIKLSMLVAEDEIERAANAVHNNLVDDTSISLNK